MKVIQSLMPVFLMLALTHVAKASTPSITEITVECKSSWIGFMYKYTFRQDGTITFIAPNSRSESPTTNTYYGRFDDFGRLARMIEQTKFFSLEPEYVADEFDASETIVTAVRKGKRYQVREYGREGPSILHAVQELLVTAARGIKWSNAP